MPHNQWLKEAGLYRNFKRYDSFGCLLPAWIWLASTVLTIFLIVTRTALHGYWWTIPLIALVATIIFRRYAHYVFFNKIVCPHCGDNPARRKSDGRPRKDPSKVRRELERYEVCRLCGDRDRT